MNLHIFENISNQVIFGNNIYHYNKFGIIFLLLSIVLLLFVKRDYKKIKFIILLFTAGLYIFYSDFIDESFVSPRMSFILNNYSSFSFFENFKNQASVEILQTIISAPFLKTTSSIILSYYLTHLFLTLLTIYFFLKILELNKFNNIKDYFTVIVLLFLSFNFFKSSSSGLGLNLMSALIFFSLFCYYQKKIFFHKFTYSILPLIRPDGILYSTIFIIANIANDRKIDVKPIILSLFSFGTYYLVVNFYFDQWPPPPMAFKSFPISSIFGSLQDPLKYYELIIFVKDHLIQLSVIALFILIFFLKFGLSFELYKNFLNKYIYEIFLLIGFIGIFLFYNFLSYHQHGDFRYSMIVTLFLSFIAIKIIFNSKIFNKKHITFLAIISLIHLYYGSSNLYYIFSDKKIAQNTYFESYKFAAIELKNLKIKKDIKIASVEMASFPFYLERDVLDLYGYSNLDISRSNICNFNNLKINPSLLEGEKPDLIFERAVPNNYYYLIGEKKEFKDRVTDLENYLLQDYFSKKENNYGDLNYLLNNYDFILLEYERLASLYLVKKTYLNRFYEVILNNNYKFSQKKTYDKESFLKIYNNIADKNISC